MTSTVQGIQGEASGLADRERRVAVAAYYKSEHRGFVPGHELADWLAAEQEVDAEQAARSKTAVAARY